MTPHSISLDTARLMLLEMQGLTHPPSQPASKADVLDTIQRIGALQIDTINIVARAPYLILYSRLGSYPLAWLDELLAEGRLFEYWSHAACFIPIEDYPLYVSRMEKMNRYYYTPEWIAENQAVIDLVMQRIREGGPVQSSDFERTDGKKGSWWDWKIEKRVLEYLHTSGELMIARREKFQRVYDLRERVLAGRNGAPALSLEEAQDELAVRSVRALGAAPARWIHDYFRLYKQSIASRVERLAESGRLERIHVKGREEPWYVHPDNLPLLERAQAGEIIPTHSTLLSPFDPLVSDRERGRELFDFDYTIECYLPQAKRKYGYFSLPLLRKGAIIGRVDAKAYRKEGIFEVRSLHLEPGVPPGEEIAADAAGAIQRCANWHGTPKVEVRQTEPAVFAEMLKF